MPKFGSDIVGRTFRQGSRIFMVMEIEPFPSGKVSSQYQQILDLDPGNLAAVPYRGILIPNITLKGGVVRLKQVAFKGKVLTGPKAISQALGLKKPYHGYSLVSIA